MLNLDFPPAPSAVHPILGYVDPLAPENLVPDLALSRRLTPLSDLDLPLEILASSGLYLGSFSLACRSALDGAEL